jgi:hypothetical protein
VFDRNKVGDQIEKGKGGILIKQRLLINLVQNRTRNVSGITESTIRGLFDPDFPRIERIADQTGMFSEISDGNSSKKDQTNVW